MGFAKDGTAFWRKNHWAGSPADLKGWRKSQAVDAVRIIDFFIIKMISTGNRSRGKND